MKTSEQDFVSDSQQLQAVFAKVGKDSHVQFQMSQVGTNATDIEAIQSVFQCRNHAHHALSDQHTIRLVVAQKDFAVMRS